MFGTKLESAELFFKNETNIVSNNRILLVRRACRSMNGQFVFEKGAPFECFQTVQVHGVLLPPRWLDPNIVIIDVVLKNKAGDASGVL